MKLFKREQVWHIAWVASIPGRSNVSYGDGTYTISTKLAPESINNLRTIMSEYVSDYCGIRVLPSQINIISMTRLS